MPEILEMLCRCGLLEILMLLNMDDFIKLCKLLMLRVRLAPPKLLMMGALLIMIKLVRWLSCLSCLRCLTREFCLSARTES